MINKAFRVTPPPKAAYSLAFGALLLLLFIVNPANSAFQCTQCPENFYCTGGQKLACPAEKPVTGKLGATECKTCEEIDNALTPVTVNGACLSCYDSSKDSANVTHVWKNKTCMTCDAADENYPAFVEGEGCVTCAQANGNDTEYHWDKTAKTCVACRASDNMTWDTTAASCGCKDGYYEDYSIAVLKPDGTVAYYLSADMIFIPSNFETDYIVDENECTEMAASGNYPSITAGCTTVSSNYWATSLKYCAEQSKRLPTMLELAYLAQNIYGDLTIDEQIDSSNNGNLTIVNQELFDIIWNKRDETKTYIYINSSEQKSANAIYRRKFEELSTTASYARASTAIVSFCLDD